MNALSLCFDEEMQELIFVIRGILSGEIRIRVPGGYIVTFYGVGEIMNEHGYERGGQENP